VTAGGTLIDNTTSEILIGHEAIGRFLGIKARTVGRLARDEGLPLVKVGANRVSTRGLLVAWLEAQVREMPCRS
jgi:hypothetical protein